MKERDEREIEIGALKHELELVKMSYEKDCSQLEIEVKETRAKLQEKIMDLESLLQVSNKKVNELEETFEHEIQKLKNRELRYSCFLHSQFDVMKVWYIWISNFVDQLYLCVLSVIFMIIQ